MRRTDAGRAIAILFLAYGVYTASFVPALVVGRIVPVLLVGTLAKALLALGAAISVWRSDAWASALVVLTGVAIAALWLVEAFALGIVAYLYAIGAAALALVITIALAAYLRGHRTRLV